jgi:hypothetical protein
LKNSTTALEFNTTADFEFDLDMSAFEGLPPIATLSQSESVSWGENGGVNKNDRNNHIQMALENSRSASNESIGMEGNDLFKEALDELDEFLCSSVVVTMEGNI